MKNKCSRLCKRVNTGCSVEYFSNYLKCFLISFFKISVWDLERLMVTLHSTFILKIFWKISGLNSLISFIVSKNTFKYWFITSGNSASIIYSHAILMKYPSLRNLVFELQTTSTPSALTIIAACSSIIFWFPTSI